ncbi:hypothetical protein L873DRAFT_768245 [Choiromyces venosus 120613-1]|uniref:Uncharacterized protein n=1 Tax=Choiromyces venosus 120613-1 TaxID=1336337 RepID=A0A3N4IX88_9PEZI|nr:hypothetical protein L873DRAFT_768245 [Choiromyces venosus 120613-1]
MCPLFILPTVQFLKLKPTPILQSMLFKRDKGFFLSQRVPWTTVNLNNCRLCSSAVLCYAVQNFLLWKGGQKHCKNTAPFPPPRLEKNQRFLNLTKRGKPNDIAHRPITQGSTVQNKRGRCIHPE